MVILGLPRFPDSGKMSCDKERGVRASNNDSLTDSEGIQRWASHKLNEQLNERVDLLIPVDKTKIF